jgi:hypothetical protein
MTVEFLEFIIGCRGRYGLLQLTQIRSASNAMSTTADFLKTLLALTPRMDEFQARWMGP